MMDRAETAQSLCTASLRGPAGELAYLHAPPAEGGAGRSSFDETGVLLVHGNSSCKEIFAHQLAALTAAGYAVAAPDLPGHGASEDAREPETDYSFPGYARSIGALLDALGWRRAHVVGWSLGGHIGLELMATDERVASLSIVGTPPGKPSAEAAAAAFHEGPAMEFAGKPAFSSEDAFAYCEAMLGGADLVTDPLLAAARRTDGRARRFMMANAMAGVGTDQRHTVETSETPLLVVHGRQDPFVRLDYLEKIHYRAAWGGGVVVIDAAGHAPHWQCPATFNAIARDFLQLANE